MANDAYDNERDVLDEEMQKMRETHTEQSAQILTPTEAVAQARARCQLPTNVIRSVNNRLLVGIGKALRGDHEPIKITGLEDGEFALLTRYLKERGWQVNLRKDSDAQMLVVKIPYLEAAKAENA